MFVDAPRCKHLIQVTLKKELRQKRKGLMHVTFATVSNGALNCIIISDAVRCNKDHLNSFAIYSKIKKFTPVTQFRENNSIA